MFTYKNVMWVDTETTSVDYNEAEILQVAVGAFNAQNSSVITVQDWFYDVDGEISPMCSSINNIVKSMVVGKPRFKDSNDLNNFIRNNDIRYAVAHNAKFDAAVLKHNGLDVNLRWICTLRMAKKLFHDNSTFENFQLNYLRYRLGVQVENSSLHEAKFDVLLCSKIFDCLAEICIELGLVSNGDDLMEEIYEWAKQPIIYTTMPIGKHKGIPMMDVPMDYWSWALDNMDLLDSTSEKYDYDFAESVAYCFEQKGF